MRIWETEARSQNKSRIPRPFMGFGMMVMTIHFLIHFILLFCHFDPREKSCLIPISYFDFPIINVTIVPPEDLRNTHCFIT
jgi:hypothetical protein